MDPLKTVLQIWKDCRAAAAVEMALVTPLLMIIMFGSFELGNYFYNEHIVVKAVRDGARYAARRSYADYSGCTPSPGLKSDVQSVTGTGRLTFSGTPRLAYWTTAAGLADQTAIKGTIAVTVNVPCDTTSVTNGTYSGIYKGQALGALVVTVTATVPYVSLFGSLGLNTTGFTLNATSQAAVMGI